MAHTLGIEHVPLVNKIVDQFNGVSPVNQQIAIELVLARHVMLATDGERDKAEFIIDSVRKHVLQIVRSWT